MFVIVLIKLKEARALNERRSYMVHGLSYDFCSSFSVVNGDLQPSMLPCFAVQLMLLDHLIVIYFVADVIKLLLLLALSSFTFHFFFVIPFVVVAVVVVFAFAFVIVVVAAAAAAAAVFCCLYLCFCLLVVSPESELLGSILDSCFLFLH